MIGYDGSIKVADFGIAKAAHRVATTAAGTLKGKVPYMAPEQCRGVSIDRRSDLFSLGIVLYELVTVRRLFKGASDYQTMRAIVYGDIPRPSLERHDLPPGLEAIILKALARAPAERYQTADEMRVALETFARETSLLSSLARLTAYMEQLFGHRVEPWLVDEQTEVVVDFDGAEHGLAPAPENAEETFDIDSLIGQARERTSPAVAVSVPPLASAAPRPSEPKPKPLPRTPSLLDPTLRHSGPAVPRKPILPAPRLAAQSPTPNLARRVSHPAITFPVTEPAVLAPAPPVVGPVSPDADEPTEVETVALQPDLPAAPSTAVVDVLPAPSDDNDSVDGPPVSSNVRRRFIIGGTVAVAIVALAVVIGMGGSEGSPPHRGDLPKPVSAEPPPDLTRAADPIVANDAVQAAPAPEPPALPPESPAADTPREPGPEAKPLERALHRKPASKSAAKAAKPAKPAKPKPTASSLYDPNSLFLKKK